MFSNFFLGIILISSISNALATEQRLIKVIESQGVVVTPKKTALRRFAQEGYPALAEIKKQQEKAREQKQLEGQREKEAEEEKRAAERQRLIEERKKAEEEAEHLKAAHQEAQEQLQMKIKSLQEERKKQEAEATRHKEEAKRLKEEIQRLEQEAQPDPDARLAFKGEVSAEILDQLKSLEEENNELLNALASLRGGQTAIPADKITFVPHSSSYIHTSQLRAPNEELDEGLGKKLGAIQDNLESLLKFVSKDTSLKAVQKMITKQQINRLTEAAEDFEAATFLRVFNEVQSQLPKLAANETFKEIETDATWFIENKAALSKVGEHRTYIKRQQEVAKLVQSKTEEFNEFYDDYLDRIVAEMCQCLTPETKDGGAVRDAKLLFRYKLQTSSIPGVRNFLGQLTKFGTNDAFLNTTFLQMGKLETYDSFKGVLVAYSSLFNALGENAKLVDELLNLQFFQNRFRRCQSDLESLDITCIEDADVQDILKSMKEENVLDYSKAKTAVFSTKANAALEKYMMKVAISPEEILLKNAVSKILIAYCQVDYFATSLAAANPKVKDFHR